MEDTLAKAKDQLFLFGDQMTLADISTTAFFLKVVYNDKFDHSLILAAIVSKYPLVKAYLEHKKALFAEWNATQPYPF